MNEIIALIIPSIFLFIYIIFSSIEYGISVFKLFPKILGDNTIIDNYIQPVWETTNVFLVFPIISLFVFFPKANFYFGTFLLVPLFLGLIFMLFRSLCMLVIFYGKTDKAFINVLFFLSSFLAPIVLSNVFLYFLTGNVSLFFKSPIALSIEFLVSLIILILPLTFFQYLNQEVRKNKIITKIVFIISCLFLPAILLITFFIIKENSHLFNNKLAIIAEGLVSFSLALVFTTQVFKKFKYNFLAIVFLIGSLFFSAISLNFPYLIYPKITIYNSFTDPSIFPLYLISFIISLIILIPSLFLLYYLFINQKSR